MLLSSALSIALLIHSPQEILERMRAAQSGLESLKARVEQVKSYPQLGIEDPIEKGFLYFAPGKMRLEIREPEVRILLVKDGKYVLYQPRIRQAISGKVDGQGTKGLFPGLLTGSSESFRELEKSYDPSDLGEEDLSGPEGPPSDVPREIGSPGLLSGDRSVHRRCAPPSGAAEMRRSEPQRDHPDARGHRARRSPREKRLRGGHSRRRRENRAGEGRMKMLAIALLLAAPEAGTVAGWNRVVDLTEARIARELSSTTGFLASDFLPPAERDRVSRAFEAGEVFTTRLPVEVEIPGGMAHHWLGAVLVPDGEVQDLVRWLQEYDEHDERFDDVEDSRLLSRDGDRFEIFLKLRRKKIVTVHYATKHEVVYRSHGPGRYSSASRATRIAELEDAGTRDEREKPPGEDRGFLWRLNSYWRFQQVRGGVVVECESLSLSRGVPTAVRWIVAPYLNSVPRESLLSTLLPIREHGLSAKKHLRTSLELSLEQGVPADGLGKRKPVGDDRSEVVLFLPHER